MLRIELGLNCAVSNHTAAVWDPVLLPEMRHLCSSDSSDSNLISEKNSFGQKGQKRTKRPKYILKEKEHHEKVYL